MTRRDKLVVDMTISIEEIDQLELMLLLTSFFGCYCLVSESYPQTSNFHCLWQEVWVSLKQFFQSNVMLFIFNIQHSWHKIHRNPLHYYDKIHWYVFYDSSLMLHMSLMVCWGSFTLAFWTTATLSVIIA